MVSVISRMKNWWVLVFYLVLYCAVFLPNYCLIAATWVTACHLLTVSSVVALLVANQIKRLSQAIPQYYRQSQINRSLLIMVFILHQNWAIGFIFDEHAYYYCFSGL